MIRVSGDDDSLEEAGDVDGDAEDDDGDEVEGEADAAGAGHGERAVGERATDGQVALAGDHHGQEDGAGETEDTLRPATGQTASVSAANYRNYISCA